MFTFSHRNLYYCKKFLHSFNPFLLLHWIIRSIIDFRVASCCFICQFIIFRRVFGRWWGNLFDQFRYHGQPIVRVLNIISKLRGNWGHFTKVLWDIAWSLCTWPLIMIWIISYMGLRIVLHRFGHSNDTLNRVIQPLNYNQLINLKLDSFLTLSLVHFPLFPL